MERKIRNMPPIEDVKPSTRVYFLNNDLVRIVHINKSDNIITVYNTNQDKTQTMLLSDFKKHRKRAYRTKDCATLLSLSAVQLNRHIRSGFVHPPKTPTLGGERKFHHLSYYSEDDLFILRDSLSQVHRGRPRKDGRITNYGIPTERELRSRLGDAMMLYAKNKSGEFIPVWEERAL